LLLAVPILDTSVAVISRLRRDLAIPRRPATTQVIGLIRAGLARPVAAVALWVLSGIFAGCAVLIECRKSSEEIIIAIAAALWLGLFIFFIRTADS
jgi:UDP-GlcNAc:undecaprenyl-phosphate GlcNAc-1-phosphate transferase